MMFRLPLFLAGLMTILPVADTVWWSTPSGQVIEHKEGSIAECTLTLRDDYTTSYWVWRHDEPTHAMVRRGDWHFGDDAPLEIAMQIGPVWLGRGNGAPNLTALGRDTTVIFLVEQPIDDLLLAADQLTINVDKSTYSIRLQHAKMVSLILALRRCRSAIHL